MAGLEKEFWGLDTLVERIVGIQAERVQAVSDIKTGKIEGSRRTKKCFRLLLLFLLVMLLLLLLLLLSLLSSLSFAAAAAAVVFGGCRRSRRRHHRRRG